MLSCVVDKLFFMFLIFIVFLSGCCLGLLEKNRYKPKHLKRLFPVNKYDLYEIQPPNKPTAPSQGPRRNYRSGQQEVAPARKPIPEPSKE